MKILVCIKQVSDPDAMPVIDPAAMGILEDGGMTYRISGYDEYALEEAVLIRERFPGTTVDVLSVGPDRVRNAIRKALEKGADRGIHVRCEATLLAAAETAFYIAAVARPAGYDLILTGLLSDDLMQAQVGPMAAALLAIPCAVSIVKETLDLEDRTIRVTSELEGGIQEEVVLRLPCLLAVQSGINRPRYPSLSNVLRAKTVEPLTVEASNLGQPERRQALTGMAYPPRTTKGTVLGGSPEEKAIALLEILHARSLV